MYFAVDYVDMHHYEIAGLVPLLSLAGVLIQDVKRYLAAFWLSLILF